MLTQPASCVQGLGVHHTDGVVCTLVREGRNQKRLLAGIWEEAQVPGD